MEKNIEKLMHELPDYINGSITDDELRREIKNEIDSNPEFRSEYESMKSTFSFLGEAALHEPSPFYFTNLLPNINKRIDAIESKHESVMPAWLINALKFAIPVVIIILGYFIYTQITGSDDPSKEQMTHDKNTIIQDDQPNTNDDNLFSNTDDSTENGNTPEIQHSSTDRDAVNFSGSYKAGDNGGSSYTADDELDELITETATYPVTNDDPEIEAVQDLSTQEQDELLKYLENAQL